MPDLNDGFTLTCNRCGGVKYFTYYDVENNDYIEVIVDADEMEIFCDCGNLLFWNPIYGGR